MIQESHDESIFVKKFKKFVNHLWSNDIELSLVKKILSYKNAIIKDPEKGKEYLQDFFNENQTLIDSNCSNEFKDELNKLINEYKTEDSLNELVDTTAYFNKKTKKNYSDSSYISENKNLNKMSSNLNLLKKIDEFFYISDNDKVLKEWENFKDNILKNSNVEYNNKKNLKESLEVAKSLLNMNSLMPGIEKFLCANIKENYLYRPTKDYCYKVSLQSNPYADKEGTIYFDDEGTAKTYANTSKGKYNYIGKSSVNESEDINKSAHVKNADWSELEETEDVEFDFDKDENTLNEDMTTGCIPAIDKPINSSDAGKKFKDSYKAENPDLISNTSSFEKRLNDFDPYKNVSNIVKGSKTQIKKSDSLFENFSIKNHNLTDKSVDKFSVLIENNFKKKQVISFNKKDFAKFIFDNCDVRNYIKEGKFDYFSYINKKTYGFTNVLIKEYFNFKTKNKKETVESVLKESKKVFKGYNEWKSAMATLKNRNKNAKGFWDSSKNEGTIFNN